MARSSKTIFRRFSFKHRDARQAAIEIVPAAVDRGVERHPEVGAEHALHPLGEGGGSSVGVGLGNDVDDVGVPMTAPVTNTSKDATELR